MTDVWDTSALILAARDPAAGRLLEAALTADEVAITEPILLEYLNGARNVDEYGRFRQALASLPLLTTTERDWGRALDVHALLAATGPGHQRSVRLVDLVVAATAERNDAAVVHVDRDYERIASLTGQRVRWIGP